MRAFTYCVPTRVVFGNDTADQVAQQVQAFGGSKVLVVYGAGSVTKTGLLDRVIAGLESAKIGYDLFGGAVPNPRLQHAREGVKKALESQADFILAVGGGSAIDTAKAIAHGAANPETDIWEFWMGKAVPKTTPVGVVLTIPAAGSETSNSAVLTNDEDNYKAGLTTEYNRPVFAILDPKLMVTVPKYQLACGITDIMMHTLDRYFNEAWDNQLSDAFAEALLRTVIANGKKIIDNPNDLEAMSEIVWAGSVSHNGLTGLGNVKDFTPHALSHMVSGKYDVPHGAALAAIWGNWARYVMDFAPERFIQFARNVWGLETALDGIKANENYFHSLGMPVGFHGLTGKLSQEELVEMALVRSNNKTATVGSMKKLTYEDILAVYQMANER